MKRFYERTFPWIGKNVKIRLSEEHYNAMLERWNVKNASRFSSFDNSSFDDCLMINIPCSLCIEYFYDYDDNYDVRHCNRCPLHKFSKMSAFPNKIQPYLHYFRILPNYGCSKFLALFAIKLGSRALRSFELLAINKYVIQWNYRDNRKARYFINEVFKELRKFRLKR